MTWFREDVYPDFAQMMRCEEMLHRRVTPHQTIEVYSTRRFGRMLAIDGAVQLTQADNHIYHEMLAHVPLLSHGNVADVLIIGGGDGGVLSEVLKHPVRKVRLVELDYEVIEVTGRFFPEVSGQSFRDPRVELVLENAALHVQNTRDVFDLILVDSTDPAGPGGSLFTSYFYQECRSLLRRDGAIVVQAGAPLAMETQARDAADAFHAVFGSPETYIASVPSCPMGMICFRGKSLGGWRLIGDEATLDRRYRQAKLATHHYDPRSHRAAFDSFPRRSVQRCQDIALASALVSVTR